MLGRVLALRLGLGVPCHPFRRRMVAQPWAMIDVITASAAISKIRSADVIHRARISTENAIIATLLGPNQPMNAFALTLNPVPIGDTNIAAGRVASSVTATIATAAHPQEVVPKGLKKMAGCGTAAWSASRFSASR